MGGNRKLARTASRTRGARFKIYEGALLAVCFACKIGKCGENEKFFLRNRHPVFEYKFACTKT